MKRQKKANIAHKDKCIWAKDMFNSETRYKLMYYNNFVLHEIHNNILFIFIYQICIAVNNLLNKKVLIYALLNWPTTSRHIYKIEIHVCDIICAYIQIAFL